MEIDDDIPEHKGMDGRRTIGRDSRTRSFSQVCLQLARSILRKRENIRRAIHSAVFGIENPHPPVAHEEDADISLRKPEQTEKFPEKPCRFGRVYLYEPLLVLYGDLHCRIQSPGNPRVCGICRSKYR